MEGLLEELSLSRSSSSSDFYGIDLCEGVPITPPLAPTPSPPFPSPVQLQPAPRPRRRASHCWSPTEILEVVALYKKHGRKFRRIARLTLRSEGAVRGILVRRGFLPPPQKRLKPAAPQARWTAAEDAALLAAIETTPRNERSGDFRWKAICKAAGLNRKSHAIRNRMGRLALEGVVSE